MKIRLNFQGFTICYKATQLHRGMKTDRKRSTPLILVKNWATCETCRSCEVKINIWPKDYFIQPFFNYSEKRLVRRLRPSHSTTRSRLLRLVNASPGLAYSRSSWAFHYASKQTYGRTLRNCCFADQIDSPTEGTSIASALRNWPIKFCNFTHRMRFADTDKSLQNSDT